MNFKFDENEKFCRVTGSVANFAVPRKRKFDEFILPQQVQAGIGNMYFLLLLVRALTDSGNGA